MPNLTSVQSGRRRQTLSEASFFERQIFLILLRKKIPGAGKELTCLRLFGLYKDFQMAFQIAKQSEYHLVLRSTSGIRGGVAQT
jgi:hypothetical protein